MPYLLLKEVPRYECLQAAAARVPGADPAICQLFLNILHTGDVVSRGEADFLARHGLNQARLIVLVLLDNSANGRCVLRSWLSTPTSAGPPSRDYSTRLRGRDLSSELTMFAIAGHRVWNITPKGQCASPQSPATFGSLDGRHTFRVERSGAGPAGGALAENQRAFAERRDHSNS